MTLWWLTILCIHWAVQGTPTILWWALLVPMFVQDYWDFDKNKRQEREAQQARNEVASWSKQ